MENGERAREGAEGLLVGGDRRIYPRPPAPFLPPSRGHKFSLFVLLSLGTERGMPGVSIVGRLRRTMPRCPCSCRAGNKFLMSH